MTTPATPAILIFQDGRARLDSLIIFILFKLKGHPCGLSCGLSCLPPRLENIFRDDLDELHLEGQGRECGNESLGAARPGPDKVSPKPAPARRKCSEHATDPIVKPPRATAAAVAALGSGCYVRLRAVAICELVRDDDGRRTTDLRAARTARELAAQCGGAGRPRGRVPQGQGSRGRAGAGSWTLTWESPSAKPGIVCLSLNSAGSPRSNESSNTLPLGSEPL
jgi:hypothetical protein